MRVIRDHKWNKLVSMSVTLSILQGHMLAASLLHQIIKHLSLVLSQLPENKGMPCDHAWEAGPWGPPSQHLVTNNQ